VQWMKKTFCPDPGALNDGFQAARLQTEAGNWIPIGQKVDIVHPLLASKMVSALLVN
jgi:hypothetical protein